MKIIGTITFTIIVIIYASLLSGWTLSKLWLWFIVTQFQVKPLSIPSAIGLLIVVKCLTGTSKPAKDKKPFWEQMLELAIFVTILCALLIGNGAIIKLFI